jgi:hypothetical protein
MAERPYSRYTRARTWAALYSQHLTAGYALVPLSATNNSIAVISCLDTKNANQDLAKDTQDMANLLLKHEEECAAYYSRKLTPDQAPAILAKARQAVLLARSSDYYHYHLEDHPGDLDRRIGQRQPGRPRLVRPLTAQDAASHHVGGRCATTHALSWPTAGLLDRGRTAGDRQQDQ